jgi:hypothetical protein
MREAVGLSLLLGEGGRGLCCVGVPVRPAGFRAERVSKKERITRGFPGETGQVAVLPLFFGGPYGVQEGGRGGATEVGSHAGSIG